MKEDVQLGLNRIQGKVLTELGGVGVPNLVVAAFDFDPQRWAQFIKLQSGTQLEGDVPVGDILSAMNDMGEGVQLQRLGSVITSDTGEFELTYADAMFSDTVEVGGETIDRDRRPDIILLVLMPDRADQYGEGLQLKDRLLHYTRHVQYESGRTESFVIRISEDRLREAGVPFPSAATSDERELVVSVSHYESTRNQEHQAEVQLRSTKQALHASLDVPQLVIEKQLVDRVLPTLLPRRLGTAPNFVGLTPDASLINQHVLDQFRNLPWLQSGTEARTGRVYLSAQDLLRLGIVHNGSLDGEGAPVSFSALLNRIGYASGPYRNRTLLDQVMVRRALSELDRVAPSVEPPPSENGESSAATSQTVRESVLMRLQEQSQALGREGRLANPANDLARIKHTIEQLEQTSGLTNAAAVHQVQSLQVAFEPAWTAAFDQEVKEQVQRLYREVVREEIYAGNGLTMPAIDDINNIQQLKELLGDIINVSNSRNSAAYRGIGALAAGLARKLVEPYSFQYFAAGSVNYGMLLTYRQAWTPLGYQVGRLAETIPLAPGEARTFKVTRTLKSSRKTQRRDRSNVQRNDESNRVSRSELEAIEKTAQAMSNQFSTQTEAGLDVIGSVSTTSQFSNNQSREAQSIHKTFAEMARKSSEEVRKELEVQVDEESSAESMSEHTRTLKNPNDELTVTYLLYELDRRFRVSSQIQSVQPVILVALDMPAPDEINDVWLLQHSWILRDALLDRRFEEALDLLERRRSQEATEIAVFKANYDAAAATFQKADVEFERLSRLARERRSLIVDLMQQEGGARAAEAGTGERVVRGILSLGLSELFGGGQSDLDERLRAQREAAEKALEYIDSEISAASAARDQALANLNAVSERYAAAIADKAMADQKLLQLRLHVRGNIFHYMHEIWRRRDHDDLFFSLYDLEVPFLEPQPGQCRLRRPTPEEIEQNVPGVIVRGEMYMVDIHPATAPAALESIPRRRLIEIADVDRPLGFKGNYVIFPLKQSCMLTDYMTVGYLDGYYGVRDPAWGASYSASELLEYARNVWNDPVVNLSETEKQQLADLITDAAFHVSGYETEVVLPTGQVYMDALKGDQALLEDFKLAHRGLDVLKVEEEVRHARIDNLRQIQRLGLVEPELDDPDVEKVTIIKGQPAGVVVGTQ